MYHRDRACQRHASGLSVLSMARQGYNPLSAIQIALNGNAGTMLENPRQKAPLDYEQGSE